MFTEEDEREWSEEKKEGVYHGTLKGVKKCTSKKDGSRYLILSYLGEGVGEYDHFLRLETKADKSRAKNQLTLLGVNCECKLSELFYEVEKVLETPVTFELTKNGQYTNCKVLGGAVGGQDVPF